MRDEWAAQALFSVAADDHAGGRAVPAPDAADAWAERPRLLVSDEERAARALLIRVIEPAEVPWGAAIQRFGAAGVVERVRGGALELPGAAAMRVRMDGLDGATELAAGAACGAVLLCPGDAEWPEGLDDLGLVGPVGLWVRSAARLRVGVAESVSIVGSRAATPYGVHVATELAADLAEQSRAVVSGCAFGIDIAAHRGALAVGGYTVGVLAGGVDVPYPREHAALIDRMVDEGAVVSEAAPGAAPVRRRFLTRNRTFQHSGIRSLEFT